MENNGFRVAAEKILISQSSVSAAIKTLEEEFGVKFIKRRESSYDKMELTEAGKSFYFTAKEILNLKEKVCKDMEVLRGKEGAPHHKETVKIVTNGALGGHLLPKLIEKFKSNFDQLNLKLTIETDDYSYMAGLFKNDTCDIGIIPIDVNAPFTNLIFTFEQRLAIFSSKYFHVATLQDFEKLPLVLMPKSFFTRELLDEFFINNKISPNIVMELNYPYVIKELIKTENFVSILHYVTVREEICRGELVEIKPPFKLPPITYKLVVNQKSANQKYLNEITDFLSVLKSNLDE